MNRLIIITLAGAMAFGGCGTAMQAGGTQGEVDSAGMAVRQAVHLTAHQERALGVVYTTTRRETLTRTIRTVGRIDRPPGTSARCGIHDNSSRNANPNHPDRGSYRATRTQDRGHHAQDRRVRGRAVRQLHRGVGAQRSTAPHDLQPDARRSTGGTAHGQASCLPG